MEEDKKVTETVIENTEKNAAEDKALSACDAEDAKAGVDGDGAASDAVQDVSKPDKPEGEAASTETLATNDEASGEDTGKAPGKDQDKDPGKDQGDAAGKAVMFEDDEDSDQTQAGYTQALEARRRARAEREKDERAQAEIKGGMGLGMENETEKVINAAPEVPEPDPETQEIINKIRSLKRESRDRNRRKRITLVTLAAVIILAIGLLIFSMSGFFTTMYIEVNGNSHFTAEEIINIGHAVPGRNLIYRPGKKEIEDYLLQNPYIKEADVHRKLPSTLVINVTERKQLCAFSYDEDYLVMDEEGILLKKTRTKPKLTMVKGMVVSRIKLGEKIGVKKPAVFDRALELLRAMKKADMYFVELDMTDDPNIRAYVYDTLIVRTDYDTLAANLKNDRLHKVVEKLFEGGIKRGTITFGDDGNASFEPGI